MRRHAGLGPDMGKVREFHEATAGSIRYFADSCRAGLPAVAAKQRRLVPWRASQCELTVLTSQGNL
jgi:hypothetical protein